MEHGGAAQPGPRCAQGTAGRRTRTALRVAGRKKRLPDALKECGDGWAFPLVSLAIETGMGRGEWPNLHWKDADLERQAMVLHHGETKNRIVGHPPMCVAWSMAS
ncbi:MAG: hypothetical protein ACREPJ_07540 [Rhodanobacteraceae bacterium]